MSVDTLLEWYSLASDAEREAGTAWYRDARACAEYVARIGGHPVTVGAAVLAVLSPQSHWADNKRAAITVALAHRDRAPMPESLAGVYGTNIRKAWSILDAGAAEVCDGTRVRADGRAIRCSPKRHGCRAHVHGPKVAEFYRTILGDLDGRVLDVWAVRAATVRPREVPSLHAADARRRGLPGERWAELQTAYLDAAAVVEVEPAHFQATVWLVIRRAWLRADGRRNGKRD